MRLTKYICIFITLIIGSFIKAKAQYSYEAQFMAVGEEKTIKLPFSVTNKNTIGGHWVNDSPNYVDIIKKSDYSVTIKILKYTSTTCLVYYDYYLADNMKRENYTISIDIKKPKKLVLSASPSGGTVEVGTIVKLDVTVNGNQVSGVNIYYTLNGTTPSKNSSKYTSSGITITEECTLKAIAYKDGNETSDVLSSRYYLSQSSVPVSGISLDSSSESLYVGGTKQLSATVYPTNATNKNVTWSSNANNVATVSNGFVTAVGEGKATITCTANDGSGKCAMCEVTVMEEPSADAIEINATIFPDANFRAYLLAQDYGKDGKLTESEIQRVSMIDVTRKGVGNLKGIGYFTALTQLLCRENTLSTLDVSNNIALEILECSDNLLAYLDVSKNTELKTLSCSNNHLTSLDVTKNTKLVSLSCSDNQLTSIDVSKNTLLSNLYCNNNQLSSLDVSKNTLLSGLYCTNNQLSSLDISRNKSLISLWCNWNKIVLLDVLKNIYLIDLCCGNNQLTSLDVSKNTALKDLSCGNNQLTSLDVSKNSKLASLDCSTNQLSSLNVSNNTALVDITCARNIIKGSSMDKLINSLPTIKSGIIMIVNDVISSLEGNVCTKKHVAIAKEKGWLPMYWENGRWAEYEGSDEATAINDVNGDNTVDGADLVALVNMILGKTDKKTEADVNGDGTVDGADYVALVNIVLGKTSNARKMAAASMSKLQIEPFDIKAGETKEMLIDLSNPNDDVTLVQFDLQLPDGLAIAKEDGEYAIDIAGRTTWKKHSLDANATGGIVRFLLSSSKNSVIEGNSGNIISVKLTASSTFKGGDVKLRNILLVTPDEKKIQPDDCTLTIKQQGDGGGANVDTGNAKLSIGDFSINAGETKEMLINLTNPDDEITLVQFDLRLPNGLSIATSGGDYDIDIVGRTTWKKHSLDVNAIDGIVRFLLSSSKNSVLEGNSGSIISIKLKASSTFSGGTIALENILLVTPDEKQIKPQKESISLVINDEHDDKSDFAVAQVSAGGSHSLFLMKNGTVWACGNNVSGELGDGSAVNQVKPIQITSDVVSISAGSNYSLFCKKDGSVWACGNNSYGQFGLGSYYHQWSLNPIEVMSDVISISAGDGHSLFCKKDGTVWACGYNNVGQLGIGSKNESIWKPNMIMPDVKYIYAGYRNSFFVKIDDSLWACGENAFGTLGDGTNTDRLLPVLISSEVASVAAGLFHYIFVKKDGSLWACGSGAKKMAGKEISTDELTPIKIMSDVSTIAAGPNFYLIVKKDGSLWACGDNNFGELGDGTAKSRETPVMIMSDVIFVTAGNHHSIIVKKDGSIWVCGDNRFGQLGDGTTKWKLTPVMIFDGKNWVGATAVNDVESQPDITGGVAVYSLSGQRLAAPQKGVNIIGGKKVVMK